ncbi:MAG: hypothetical protein HQ471_07995 [Flavobacteriales bacterium]|nr:hypothetical protein [Flavobacteriales bacterium]
MKSQLKFRFVFLAILSGFLFLASSQGYAQKVKKRSVRLKAQYVKIVDHETYFNITATSKVKKENINVSGIEILVFNEVGDDKIMIGKTKTNMKGESKFALDNILSLTPDETNTYNIVFSFKGNDSFKKASKSISFKDATIKTQLVTKDSVNYVSATLTDSKSGNPIAGESLNVQIQRLFKPLKIGKEFNSTDETGAIFVPIEDGIPGVDGIITIEVVLQDHDDYGTVKALLKAPIGTPIVDESTFDQRKMWSPRNKTPIFLLIFPNLLIIGIWSLIIYLVVNLFKIAKSKI